jgi:hypothetical protein
VKELEEIRLEDDSVFLKRPAGGKTKKLVATVLREGLSAS